MIMEIGLDMVEVYFSLLSQFFDNLIYYKEI